MKRRCIATLVFAGAAATVGCSQAARDEAHRLRVFVSILPQVEFVERVGGGRVEVEALVLPGQSPATYSPTPRQMARLSKAHVFFRVGVPFEEALVPRIRALSKDLIVVDTRQGVQLRRFGSEGKRTEPTGAEEDHEDEVSGQGDGHSHAGGLDPHIWLDPRLVIRQAHTIRDALIELDPGGKATYETNCASFAAELKQLHERLTKTLAPVRGRDLLVFHPAYGYFADAYGLKQVAVEAAGRAPGPRRLAETIDSARRQNIRVVFVQAQFDQNAAKAIAEAVGGQVMVLDPLAKDYARNLEDMAAKIKNALVMQKAPESPELDNETARMEER